MNEITILKSKEFKEKSKSKINSSLSNQKI